MVPLCFGFEDEKRNVFTVLGFTRIFMQFVYPQTLISKIHEKQPHIELSQKETNLLSILQHL